jgi:hypothetical protein
MRLRSLFKAFSWRGFLDAFRMIPARRVKIEDPPGCAECRRKDRLIRILMQDHHDPRL